MMGKKSKWAKFAAWLRENWMLLFAAFTIIPIYGEFELHRIEVSLWVVLTWMYKKSYTALKEEVLHQVTHIRELQEETEKSE